VPTASFIDDIIGKVADGFSGESSIFNKDGLLGGALGYSEDKRTAKVSHILFSPKDYAEDAEAMATALKSKIENGEFSFEFVAGKFSNDPTSSDKGGDLGRINRGATVPNFDQAVFQVDEAVPVGTLQGPIETEYGFHLIKVVERDGD